MQILLDKPEYEEFIRSQVDTGLYPSPMAVIEAALSRLMEPQFAPGELARLVEEGAESLRKHGPLNAEEVFRELRALRDPSRVQARK